MKSTIKAKSYRLADDRSGESFMLKTGKNGRLLVFDEESKFNRAIRHCPNEKTIFIDEQSKHALVQPIIFLGGYLEVKAQDQLTQQFLDAHPDNTANGGGWFEEVNNEKEAKEGLQDEELRLDIKQAIRNMSKDKDKGIHALTAVAAVITGSIDETSEMGIEELKRVLYNEVDADPNYFVNEAGDVTIFDDDEIFRKYTVLRALKEGILKKSANAKSMYWVKGNKLIATAPASIDLVDYFADYLTTDDGRLVAEEIARRS